MLTIDGSQGEGGGQILRTALALSAITGTPIAITNIRARRPKPGLQRQHVVALQAAAQVSRGQLEGAVLQSQQIRFFPGAPTSGDYHFDIGSAGSTTLVLQTVLPILLCAQDVSTLTIRGGTHNFMAPSYDFIQDSFLPILERCGVQVALRLERYGFYPAGGGVIQATIQPWKMKKRIDLLERGALLERQVQIVSANLPKHVANREWLILRQGLKCLDHEVKAHHVQADGFGNVIVARLRYAEVCAVFCAFGETRKLAERVAEECLEKVDRYVSRYAPVCEHLADQLLLPLALGAGGMFRTCELSEHTRTNIDIISRFLGTVVSSTDDGDSTVISVRGQSA